MNASMYFSSNSMFFSLRFQSYYCYTGRAQWLVSVSESWTVDAKPVHFDTYHEALDYLTSWFD